MFITIFTLPEAILKEWDFLCKPLHSQENLYKSKDTPLVFETSAVMILISESKFLRDPRLLEPMVIGGNSRKDWKIKIRMSKIWNEWARISSDLYF